MSMAVGSDSTNHLTREIIAHLQAKRIKLVRCGALTDKAADYVDAAGEVAEQVSSGAYEQGLLFCNTGTGVTCRAEREVDRLSPGVNRLQRGWGRA